jgi:predicted nucleotidyltransferase
MQARTAEARKGRLPRAILRDVVRRVVEASTPESIILFGSAARGEMGPHSDVDLLVVKGGRFDRARVTDRIYRSLFGVDAAVDIVVVTPDEVEKYRDEHCLVIAPALREGKSSMRRKRYAPNDPRECRVEANTNHRDLKSAPHRP